MDDETNQLLRELVDLQTEQLELTRKSLLPLWTKIRFSLLGLLVLMTLVAIGLGITAFAVRSQNSAVPPPPLPSQAPVETSI
ncbi:MAG TPA: hypothetical protein VGK56_07050 [Anaerolineales bacterium]